MKQELLQTTMNLIADQLSKTERPTIACSFGKDSIVMLYLVRQLAPEIPVLYFKAFPHPTKHEFVIKTAQELELNLLMPEPKFRDLIATNDNVELVEIFEIAPRKLAYFPIEQEPGYVPGPGFNCAVDKFMEECTPTEMNFDTIFVGHRGDDVDPTYGKVPLIEEVFESEGFRYVYPLKDWTEEDIWEFSQEVGIPQNEARYSGDMSANNDYYPMCTNCLKPGSNEQVMCPKVGHMIPSVAKGLKLAERRQTYKEVLVNIDYREAAYNA